MTAQLYATFCPILHHRHFYETQPKDIQRLPKWNSKTFKDQGSFRGFSRPWK